MARLNDEENTENDGVFCDNIRRNTVTAKIDNLPANELGLKEDVLQLANHVCELYDHWKTHPEEFCVDYDLRNKRRQTFLSLTQTMPLKRDEFQTTKEIEILDLREHTDWFINNNADLNIQFTSEETFKEAVNNQPRVWFLFLKFISNSLHYADLHIGKQENEIENLRSSNEELSSGINPQTDEKKTRYRNEILRLRKKIDIVSEERDRLLSTKHIHEVDSDDEFFNHNSTQKLSHDKPLTTSNFQTTTSTNVITHQINSSASKHGFHKPPDKIDVFDGKFRERYDEWVDKKLTYLMRHLTGSPYNLLKDKYDERTRLNPLRGRTLENALAELDRVFRARNVRLDAKTKLETLRMGNNQPFGDFFAKFQIQINKLNYNDEDKMDELKSRLNTRFAGRIILGRRETYDELVDHCYTLDSELGMYEAKKTSEYSKDPRKLPDFPLSNGKLHLDHITIELGKSSKPLSEMSLKELKDYRNSLPRSAVIKQRLLNENRCHRCMQKGHTGLDQNILDSKHLATNCLLGNENTFGICLLDSGASAFGFINHAIAQKFKFPLTLLPYKKTLNVADGTSTRQSITHTTWVDITLGDHKEKSQCYVINM
ncbi:hypothetical protein EPUL_005767, partial [Erysiphe pulchra]